MDIVTAVTAFALIFPVELPDKTFVATLVLSTRFRSLPVWLGVSAAFLVQTAVAVLAGGVLTLLPRAPVLAVTTLLFLAGAVLLLHGASAADAREAEEEAEQERELAERAESGAGASPLRMAMTSFAVLFVAEWGDLSQLFTAGLVARTGEPLSVFVGAWVALITVAGLGVLLGKTLLRYVRLSAIRRAGGIVCIALAAITVIEIVRELRGG
jgi:putative Ca2+/H+ antiporter (TMEM165/GDT1 family)